MTGKLTAAKVKAIAMPGMHGDGDTLYLNVSKSGAKSWIQRLTINGRRHDIGLGGWPVVSLAKARKRAFDNRVAIDEGRDPLAEKRKAKMPTFHEAARRTYEANRPRWRNAKVEKTWWQQLERHALPALGNLPVDRIGREDVLRVLTPIWTRHPEAARKLRQRIRAILAWAEAHGFADRNVAGDAIAGALPSMPAVKEHFRALPYGEVAGALATVEASGASVAAKACLRFIVLTAARYGEARGATWGEIDIEAREWRIPASRMKAGVEHRVPLSDTALAVLEEMRPFRETGDFIFPSPYGKGRPLSDMALTRMLRATGLADRATIHGFRSSFRDWCAERGTQRDVAEAALAHTVGGVEGAYFRSDLYERRRVLMDQWADYLTGEPAEVVSIFAS